MKFLKAAKSDAQKPKTKKEFLAQKALKKKKLMRIGGGVFAFIAFLIWFGLQPLRATTEYGICKTYIERMIQFPTSLDVTTFDIFGNAVRIFFTHRDGSGSTRSQQIECRINPDIENIYVIVSIALCLVLSLFKTLSIVIF